MAARAPTNGNKGGYDYEFVKTPSNNLICTVCFLPSKEPNLSACCGHTFCTSCLEGSKKFSKICPMCRSEEFITIFNKQADRDIRGLHVFCTNKKQGCEWQNEVNDITNHLGNCLFQVIHCPNDCGESLQRQYLTSHVETECPHRTVSCQYCNDVGEFQFIEGQHKEECPKLPVQCPNECEIESIHRDEVEEHREVCPLEMIQCDYHVVGCKVKMARKDMDTHKQGKMEVHLSLSINELMETKTQLESTQNKLNREVQKTKDDLTQQLVLYTTKLADTEKQLIASQQEAKETRDELIQRIVLVENNFSSSKKQLIIVEQAANTQFSTIKNLRQQLISSQQEAKKIKDDLTEQLKCTEKNLTVKLMASQQQANKTEEDLIAKLTTSQQQANKMKEDLTQQLKSTERSLTAKLMASKQEAKRTTDQLLQKLTATEKELDTTKQQLATTCENLTKAEKEHTTLATSTDKALYELRNRLEPKFGSAWKKGW